MNFGIELRNAATPGDEKPAAWFMPGNHPERWLEELARCGLANLVTRLYLVPRSRSDQQIAGLLVVPADSAPMESMPVGVACRCVAGRLFMPIDAVLHPPVSDEELREICPWPVAFFHPILGVAGFDEHAAATIVDWIAIPAERQINWNYARAGAVPLPAFASISMRQKPTLEDLFGDAPDEIGTDDPGQLPPAPDEPEQGRLSGAGRKLKHHFFQGIEGVLRRLPHTALRRTWANDLEDWARRSLETMDSSLDRARNKELHRLLQLLEKDPEAGLRHAIPLNDFAHRGTAPPGGRLGSRMPDFNAARLGGSKADFWQVPDHLQQVLRRRYREMADRELQLGRYRRAAYIYAELLGDLVSAAHALKQGRFFREAAVLYEEHLHNTLEAARCFAEAGLLAEALERYERLGRWLDMAELQERLGNHEAAVSSIRLAVQEHLSKDDVLAAATIVEQRLQAPEEAADLLEKAWPASRQAGSCLTPLFQILGRLAKHDRALARLARFKREQVLPMHLHPLLDALGGTARTYPAENVRHCAEDLARILIAGQLQRSAGDLHETTRIVDHLIRLAPEDRLLARDANSHLDRHRSRPQSRQLELPPPAPSGKPRLFHSFELPRQIKWLQLKREWHWFFALGVTPKRLTILRGIWHGEFQSLSWERPDTGSADWGLFEPTGEQGKCLAVAQPGAAPLTTQKFPSADALFSQPCLAGTPEWLPRQSFPVAFGEDVVWSVHVAAGRAVLSCHDKRGLLLRTLDVSAELLEGAERNEHSRVQLVVVAQHVAVALGNRLVVADGKGNLKKLEAPGQIMQLTTTLLYTRKAIAALLELGAVMHWLGTDNFIELDRDLPAPMGAFVLGGTFVLVSGWHAVTLEVDARGVHNVTRMDISGAQPVAVCGTASPGEFAMLAASGQVYLYQIPRGSR